MILTHGANSLARGKDGFILDIPNFDLTSLKQGDIQFYGGGITKSADGQKLILTSGSVLTMPLQNYNSYDFEMHFNVLQWSNYLYPSSRLFMQGSANYSNTWGYCITKPGTIVQSIQGSSYRNKWYSWGYEFECYNFTVNDNDHIKYVEECRGDNYKLYINDELVVEYNSDIDYNSLTGDANYNTSTANGLNKCGFFMESGQAEITYFRLNKIA